MSLITQVKAAELCGVTKQAISKAVKSGRCPTVTDEQGRIKIDTEDPLVRAFMRDAEQNKKLQILTDQNAQVSRPKSAPKPREREEKPREIPPAMSSAMAEELFGEDPAALKIKKLSADAELQEIKAKIKSEEYLEKLGAIVDAESLRVKMGKFTDVLITDLLYLPEEIADQLWLQAKAADADAPKVIRDLLTDRIEVIVESAKRAAREIVPDERDRRYMVIDGDSEV